MTPNPNLNFIEKDTLWTLIVRFNIFSHPGMRFDLHLNSHRSQQRFFHLNTTCRHDDQRLLLFLISSIASSSNLKDTTYSIIESWHGNSLAHESIRMSTEEMQSTSRSQSRLSESNYPKTQKNISELHCFVAFIDRKFIF